MLQFYFTIGLSHKEKILVGRISKKNLNERSFSRKVSSIN